MEFFLVLRIKNWIFNKFVWKLFSFWNSATGGADSDAAVEEEEPGEEGKEGGIGGGKSI